MTTTMTIEQTKEAEDAAYSQTDYNRQSAVLHRSIHFAPLQVSTARGHYLHLTNGRRILDATGGAAVSCLGHGKERVNAAMISQMQAFSYAHSMFFSSAAAEQLARTLVTSTHGAMSRAFICSSGSEAMEGAMKLARQYYTELSPPQPQRVRFIARRRSYHGTTLATLSLGGHKGRRALYEPLLMTHCTSHVSPCYAYRDQSSSETTAQYVARLAQELDDEFVRVGPDTVCAFVLEPVVGAATGCVPSVPGYLHAMRNVCDKYGALLIFDEIMCGMGRTGTLHAWQHPDNYVATNGRFDPVVPDIQTIGKGLGGGYAAVAGILIKQRVVDVLFQGTGAFAHGQTYQAHPVACTAALEVQRVILEANLLSNVQKSGHALERMLKARLAQHPHVGDIRGRGLFWGIEFVADRKSKEPFPAHRQVAMGVHELALQEPFSISLYPGAGTVDGKLGDHVLLAPAYDTSEEEIELIVELTGKVIEAYFKDDK